MDKIRFLIVGFLFWNLPFVGHTQSDWKFGVELDVLPYATGGYFAAAWAGQGTIRMRALYTRVNIPDFITPKGFVDQGIVSVAIIGDYFFHEGFSGWWLGGGPVYWKGQVRTDAMEETAKFENYLLNVSGGYVFNLGTRFYLCPWAGLSLRAFGDKRVAVDNKTFNPKTLNPEVSVKFGFRL